QRRHKKLGWFPRFPRASHTITARTIAGIPSSDMSRCQRSETYRFLMPTCRGRGEKPYPAREGTTTSKSSSIGSMSIESRKTLSHRKTAHLIEKPAGPAVISQPRNRDEHSKDVHCKHYQPGLCLCER